MSPTLTDIGTMAEVVRQVDSNPLTLAGRFIGLGQTEQRAGIPGWAWGALGLMAGGYVVYRYGPTIQDKLSRWL